MRNDAGAEKCEMCGYSLQASPIETMMLSIAKTVRRWWTKAAPSTGKEWVLAACLLTIWMYNVFETSANKCLQPDYRQSRERHIPQLNSLQLDSR
ncbi:hypothetical protein B7486_39735 [cyanobacterium TDX16]|nr:hypothetical protein B7486_39735 [cyanobacterium TDX16]